MKFPFSKKEKEQSSTSKKNRSQEKLSKKSYTYGASKIRKVIWTVIFLFVFFSCLSIVRSNVVANKLTIANKKIVQLEKQFSQLEMQQQLDVPETEAFFKEFIRLYGEQFKEYEKQQQRSKKLSEYYSELGKMLGQSPRVDTEVTRIENYGYERKGTENIAKFFVEIKTKAENSQTFQTILNIPFKVEKGKYQLTGLPYQQNDQRKNLIASTSYEEHQLPTNVLQDQVATKKIRTFVEQFLTEYQENNQENLKYLMKNVEGLPKGLTIETKEFTVYETEDHPVVELSLIMSYANTGVSFEENMELHLSKTTDGKYFIDQLIHY
ncbi:hypothetical protein IGK80_001124 [Enterococcus sp. DIV0609]